MDEVRDFLFNVLTSPPVVPNVAAVSAAKSHDAGEASASGPASAASSTRKSGSGRPRKRPLGPDGKPIKKMKLAGIFCLTHGQGATYPLTWSQSYEIFIYRNNLYYTGKSFE